MQAYSEKVFDELYLNIDFGIGRLATYNVQNDFIENEDLAYYCMLLTLFPILL